MLGKRSVETKFLVEDFMKSLGSCESQYKVVVFLREDLILYLDNIIFRF